MNPIVQDVLEAVGLFGLLFAALEVGYRSGKRAAGEGDPRAAGQVGAVRLGVARALIAVDAELRPVLKKAGLLTRDSRAKERKKAGRPGARKRFQFSKR